MIIFIQINQKNFKKIPGIPIGYWLIENELSNVFKNQIT